MSRAWWYQIWFLTACAVAILAGMLSRIGHAGHQRVPMAVQLAIVVAVILAVGGVAALKGRRAGIEVRQDGITVRRAWGPNRRVRWDEVRGQVKVRRAIGNTVSGPNYWLTFIALLLDNGHKVKTFGLATRQHGLLRIQERCPIRIVSAGSGGARASDRASSWPETPGRSLGSADRIKHSQRVRLELTDAQEQLSGLGIHFVYQRYNPPLARLLKQHGDSLA